MLLALYSLFCKPFVCLCRNNMKMTVNIGFFSSSLTAAVSIFECRAQHACVFSWELGLIIAELILFLMRGLCTARLFRSSLVGSVPPRSPLYSGIPPWLCVITQKIHSKQEYVIIYTWQTVYGSKLKLNYLVKVAQTICSKSNSWAQFHHMDHHPSIAICAILLFHPISWGRADGATVPKGASARLSRARGKI